MRINCICSKPFSTIIMMFMSRRNFAAGRRLAGIYADAIREQVDAMQHLTLQDDEYQWLSGLPFFKADYLNWLRDFRYKPEQVTVTNDNGKLNIRLEGRGGSDHVGSAASGGDQ
jgi:nicotinic acid phosphoribosyltransferase